VKYSCADCSLPISNRFWAIVHVLFRWHFLAKGE
jgi:hypothetical protein